MGRNNFVAWAFIGTSKIIRISGKYKYKNKNMQNHNKAVGGLQAPEFSFVYSYLAIGILLFLGVFIFLPRVAGS